MTVFCLLCGMQLFVCPALAESAGLEVTVSASPDEIVGTQDIALNFTLRNNGDETARNIVLSSSDGLISETVGEIEAHGEQSFTRRHSVTEAELEAGRISCIVSCADPENDGGVLNYTAYATISRCDPVPSVEFTRRFSGNVIRPGDALVIVYGLRNTGNIALEQLCITDSAGSYAGRVDRLDVGEMATLVNRLTMYEEDVTSDAALGFEVNGEAYTQQLKEETVRAAADGLKMTFTVEAAGTLPQTANAVLTLTADGAMPYHDLIVTDESYGGVVAEGISLAPGASPVRVEKTYALRDGQELAWRVTARRDDGSRISLPTDRLTIDPEEALIPDSVTLHAEALMPKIRRTGRVKVRVTLENNGDGDVKHLALNVKADEEPTERLYDFAVLPAGDTLTKDFEFDIAQDTHLAFAVSYDTSDGGAGATDGAFADIVISDDGVEPGGDKPKWFEISGGSIKIGGSKLFAILLIAGLAILLVLIIILITASRKAKLKEQVARIREKERRAERERQNRKGEK